MQTLSRAARTMGGAFAVAWIAAACSSALDSEGSAAGFNSGAGEGDAGTTSPFGNGADAGASTTDEGGPPETKVEGSYQSPVSTGQYVWIANPTSGLVAYIQASTLQVATVAAGDAPTYLAAVPTTTGDSAIVLNTLSSDATLMTAQGANLTTTRFPVAPDTNAWSVSADGHWALAWGDVTKVTNPDPTQGFQDVSALDLTGHAPPTIVSIGYRPTQVTFAADSSRAFAVTQDGISVVDLTGAVPAVTQNFATSTDPTDTTPADVSITPDGSYALVRRDGETNLAVVSLSDGTLTSVAMPTAPTDLTVSPAGDRALAVLRDTATVAVLPLPGIATDPTSFATVTITGQTVGRAIVADDSRTTLLFTTAYPVDAMTILDLSSMTFRTAPLHLPIYAVFPTPDAQNAIVLHTLPPDAGTSARGAFSVLPIAADLPAKLVGTGAPPNAVALSPAGDRALVTVSDTSAGVYAAYLAKMPSLEVDEYTLASPPIAAGVVAGAGVAYVAQSNAEGRITFIDLTSGQARTITGFELGARVVDGSQP